MVLLQHGDQRPPSSHKSALCLSGTTHLPLIIRHWERHNCSDGRTRCRSTAKKCPEQRLRRTAQRTKRGCKLLSGNAIPKFEFYALSHVIQITSISHSAASTASATNGLETTMETALACKEKSHHFFAFSLFR